MQGIDFKGAMLYGVDRDSHDWNLRWRPVKVDSDGNLGLRRGVVSSLGRASGMVYGGDPSVMVDLSGKILRELWISPENWATMDWRESDSDYSVIVYAEGGSVSLGIEDFVIFSDVPNSEMKAVFKFDEGLLMASSGGGVRFVNDSSGLAMYYGLRYDEGGSV